MGLFSKSKDKDKDKEKDAKKKADAKVPSLLVAKEVPKDTAKPEPSPSRIYRHEIPIGNHEERDVLFEPGRLLIEIVEARKLPAATSSPYCIVSYEHNQQLLPAGQGSTPRFNGKVTFDVTSAEFDLAIQLNERSPADKDKYFIGIVRLLPAWVPNKTFEDWYPLADAGGNSCGELNVKVTFAKAEKKKCTVDDFELLKVVGKGSFGKVMQVRKKDTGRIYAMKVLKKGHLIERDEVEHTKSERAILAKNHTNPFLVGLKFSFQTPDKIYLVLDYINGGELFAHLQNEGVFSLERSRFYAAQLVLAMGHLHENNIIYRDLKPENILVDYTGYIALTDFGLCKEDMGYGQRTNTFCGTPEYMAPEVLKQRGYGKAVDWWCIGVLLYEMLSGLPPFYDENTDQMYQKILFSELSFPEDMDPVSRSIIGQLLEKDPEKRLGSSKNGTDEIKAHPFFRPINWANLLAKRVVAPWRPPLTHQLDTAFFDSEFTSMAPQDSVVADTPLSQTQQTQFQGFTYVDGNEFLQH
eukprot:comp22077_c0_seq1/m.32171 comp22077_c0_seq1/g.32171  ORF comp22077_c0_seq1/g.32171 comp22077_c0_seq1/m.32171 type:complete len:524 (-) comp22077_c0_seq1:916-2487(-)